MKKLFLVLILLFHPILSFADDRIYFVDADIILNNSNYGKKIVNKLKKINHGAIIFDRYMEVDSFNLTNSYLNSSLNMGAKFINYDFNFEISQNDMDYVRTLDMGGSITWEYGDPLKVQ